MMHLLQAPHEDTDAATDLRSSLDGRVFGGRPGSLRTAGYNEGIVFCRWLLSEAMPETPKAELGAW